MTAALCVVCERPVPDTAYACSSCSSRAGAQLAEVAEMLPAARDIAQRQSVHGDSSAGAGKPGSQLPLSLPATARLDAVQNELVGVARLVAEERGVAVPLVAVERGPVCRACEHPSCDEIRPRAPLDVILAAVRWLPGHLEWIRHRPDADEALRTIQACARVVAGITRGPAEQRFLGLCGATITWDADGNEIERDTPCEGYVYARHSDAKDGTCRACGASWTAAPRRKRLDEEVRSHAFRASHIANAHGINVNTIRSWATRGLLASYWRTSAGLVTPWIDPTLDPKLTGDDLKARLGEIADEIQARGGRLHYVGDVLGLAAADAARRAGEQAKRARRAAAREAATSEGDAA